MKCPVCGSEITRDMRVVCENCGAPIDRNQNTAASEILIDDVEAIEKRSNISNWDSEDQRRWVIQTCAKLGLNSNHPSVVKKYKAIYNERFL